MKAFGFIAIGIDDERLYFKGTTPKYGYKVCKYGKGEDVRAQVQSCEELRDWAKKYQGNYKARFDKREKLWYIDGNRSE